MKAPNPESLKLVKDFSRQVITFGVARVPKTTRIYMGSSDFKVSEVDLTATKFEPKDLYSHASYVTTVTLAGKFLVSGGYDGKLIWWDTAQNAQVRSVDAHSKWIRKVVTSPNGKLIASVGDDMLCKIWEASTGKLVSELRGHEVQTPHHFPSMLYTTSFSTDGQYLVTADKVGHVVIWDVANGKEVTSVESPGMYTWDPVQRRHSIGGVRGAAFSPDGSLLAVSGIGRIGNIDHLDGKARIEFFDWRSKKSLGVFESEKYKGLVNKLQFSPDGAWLLGAGGAGEGFLLFLDPKTRKAVREEKASMHIHDFDLNETADALIVVGHNKIVQYKLG